MPFKKTLYYPVDVDARIIYNDPAKRELDCSFDRGYRGRNTIGIIGDRLNRFACYQAYEIRRP